MKLIGRWDVDIPEEEIVLLGSSPEFWDWLDSTIEQKGVILVNLIRFTVGYTSNE